MDSVPSGPMAAAARKAAEDYAARRMRAAKTKAGPVPAVVADRPTSPDRPPPQPAAKKSAAKKVPAAKKAPEPMLSLTPKARPQDFIWLHKVLFRASFK